MWRLTGWVQYRWSGACWDCNTLGTAVCGFIDLKFRNGDKDLGNIKSLMVIEGIGADKISWVYLEKFPLSMEPWRRIAFKWKNGMEGAGLSGTGEMQGMWPSGRGF